MFIMLLLFLGERTMVMNVVGKGKRVNVDKLWSKETEFTKWLEIQENLDILADQIDLKLSSIESEKGVGDFSADNYVLVTASEEMCVIENQFGRTDHDHLGKAILYAANLYICYNISAH